jgi:hypothetical protein
MHKPSPSTARIFRKALMTTPVCAVLVLGSGALAQAETPHAQPVSDIAPKSPKVSLYPALIEHDLSAESGPALALAGLGIVTLGAGGTFVAIASRRR